jgi:hypothetical protein
MTIKVGKTYLVNSSRKGIFAMRVTQIDEEWATGIVTGGKAKAMLDYNEREIGEEVTVRRSFCTFTQQPPSKESSHSV